MTFSSVLLSLILLMVSPCRAETVIKFATLAPEGSTWMNVMNDFNKELQSKTNGQVRFKFYPGGVAGDEKDAVRKVRLGQLQGIGVTGVGLGEIAPPVRILDAPFLFRDHAEVDHILKLYQGELSRDLEEKGFEVLGWTEVGFVYLFTNTPVRQPADLKNVKMWVWEGDPIAQAAFAAFDIHPIPLSITDVMTSLETGLINGVYSSPMAAIALQWFTKTKYITSPPLAYAAGAVLVSKPMVDALSADQRKILLGLGRQYIARLTNLSRTENDKAIQTLRKEGLTLVEVSAPATLKQYETLGEKARRSLAGNLYSADLLNRVEKSIIEFRTKRSASNSTALSRTGANAQDP